MTGYIDEILKEFGKEDQGSEAANLLGAFAALVRNESLDQETIQRQGRAIAVEFEEQVGALLKRLQGLLAKRKRDEWNISAKIAAFHSAPESGAKRLLRSDIAAHLISMEDDVEAQKRRFNVEGWRKEHLANQGRSQRMLERQAEAAFMEDTGCDLTSYRVSMGKRWPGKAAILAPYMRS